MNDAVRAAQEAWRMHNYAYEQAKAYLRSKPGFRAWLIIKDIFYAIVRAVGTAAIAVPVFWFWGAMADIPQARLDLAGADAKATWDQVIFVFQYVVIMLLALSAFTRAYSRSTDAFLDRLAQQLVAAGQVSLPPMAVMAPSKGAITPAGAGSAATAGEG